MTSTSFSARALSQIVKGGSRLIGRTGPRLVHLDDAQLLDEARRRTRLTDFGEPDVREPLRRFLQSCDTEAQLTLLGRIAVRQDTLRLLRNRLKMQEDRRRHPEIGAEEICQPLFVTGLPRTGTTLLHGLLAQDPANRAPLNWELMFPSPPPERATYWDDPHIALADQQIRWFYRLAPEFRKIHPVGARLAEECVIITSHSFLSFQFQTSFDLPSYQSWLEAQDLRPCYEVHRRFLQHLQWHGPRGPVGAQGTAACVRSRGAVRRLSGRTRDLHAPRPTGGGAVGRQPAHGVAQHLQRRRGPGRGWRRARPALGRRHHGAGCGRGMRVVHLPTGSSTSSTPISSGIPSTPYGGSTATSACRSAPMPRFACGGS